MGQTTGELRAAGTLGGRGRAHAGRALHVQGLSRLVRSGSFATAHSGSGASRRRSTMRSPTCSKASHPCLLFDGGLPRGLVRGQVGQTPCGHRNSRLVPEGYSERHIAAGELRAAGGRKVAPRADRFSQGQQAATANTTTAATTTTKPMLPLPRPIPLPRRLQLPLPLRIYLHALRICVLPLYRNY